MSTSADNDDPGEPGLIAVVPALPATAAPLDLQWVRAKLAAALDHVQRPIREVTVKIVDDAAMRDLHARHRRTAETTDVLTFDHSDPGGPVEADIVICVDEAVRRAAQMKHPVEREVLLYALHGVLHCAGFDDRRPQDFEAMHAEEDRILVAIDVGPTFGALAPQDMTEDSSGD